MYKIAVIGGTGVYDPQMLKNIQEGSLTTPFGPVVYKSGEVDGTPVVFLARHGSNHSIAPHLINYRANIWALKKLGVHSILATTAVGSLNETMQPGDFVLADQFLDFTKSRVHTFYEGGERGVVHVDLTHPYCPRLRERLAQAAETLGLSIHKQGTYVCTEGPRFETPAEIKMYAAMNGDLVGMTSVPEVVLAREAEMCYATLSMVTNFAAGVSQDVLTHGEVLDTMNANLANMKALFVQAIRLLAAEEDCACRHALREYGGFKL